MAKTKNIQIKSLRTKGADIYLLRHVNSGKVNCSYENWNFATAQK